MDEEKRSNQNYEIIESCTIGSTDVYKRQGYNRPDDIPITLSTVMQNIIDDKTLDASQGIIHHREGVDLLPSNIELSGFEVRLINAMSRERVLKTYVNEVKKNYDYVLIDCMPSLGMITINALAAVDSVIIPTPCFHFSSCKQGGKPSLFV